MTFLQVAINTNPITQHTSMRVRPWGRPQVSRIFARGNFAKPPMILDTTVIVAVRECDPKELVTNGVRALTTTSCREKMT